MAATKAPATKKVAATKSPAAKTTATKTTAAKRTTARKTTTAKKTAAKKTAAPSAAATSFAETAAAKAEAAIKSFPSVDFSKLDLSKIDLPKVDAETLKQLDPRNIELPDFDLAKVVEAARDAAYTLVGFGVLAVQRVQVQRRELAESISERFGGNRSQIEELIAAFEARLATFEETFEARLDGVVGKIGPRLPEQGEAVLNQVHSVAKSARAQVRNLLRNAA